MEIKPLINPIYLSTTYHRNGDGSYNQGYVYTSINNPNRQQLESELCILEQGEGALAFASGMAAIQAVFQSLKTGDHIIIPHDVFYQVRNLMSEVYARWGLEYSIVQMHDIEAIQAAIQPSTVLIWVETPSNPLLEIADIAAIAQIAQNNDLLLVVDNTWATPVLQNPLILGADIVIHSTTKYFGGHHDVLGGCLILKEKALEEKLRSIQKLCGGVPSPMDCWMISRGIKTLELRVRQQSATAMRLAVYLQNHPYIEAVYYPGLKSHPQYPMAKKQMKNGYGGMMSVLINGNAADAMNIANNLNHFVSATSLGGVDSLVEHRQSVEGKESRAPENLLRLSVGIEPFEILKNDWEQALKSNFDIVGKSKKY